MKKQLLSISAFCFALATTAISQTIYTQDFETHSHNTPAGLATGWTQTTSATDGGWKDSTSAALQSSNFPIPAHTQFACTNDDACNCNKSADKLVTPSMNLSAYSTVFVSFDLLYYQGCYNGPCESITLDASPDGGVTWSTFQTLTGAASWTTLTYNLSAYAGQSNVKLRFNYSDGGGWLYGACIDNLNVFSPPAYDLHVASQNMVYYIQKNASNTLTGTIANLGSTATTSMHLNYNINNGPAVTDNVTSINVLPLTTYNFTHNIPWVPSVSGNYTMKIWADNINGSNADQNHANDTLTATFRVLDSLAAKHPLFEEFNQASCDPCAAATPNLDSVLSNTQSYANAVRYHVSWPGQDFMNQETNTPFVNGRVVYYGVSGVPDAKLDGSIDIYPGGMHSSDLSAEAIKGSPFRMTMTATYNTVTKTYSASVSVKAFDTFAAGLSCRVALTVDTITYANNQSTETIPQYVFPQVAEDMLPNATGTALLAFTSLQTQNVNVSWTKNRAWGASLSTWHYDSTSVHLTAWVQDNTSKYIYQSITAPAVSITGIDEIANGISVGVYPNPMNTSATISIRLLQSEVVSVSVLNMLGETVQTIAPSQLSTGNHSIDMDASALPAGIYFVKVSAGNASATKKIVVEK